VRHKCDNRACLRIDHLEIGTQADNIADMDNRGRRISLIGTENWQAKLNEAQVVAIKARLAAGEKCAPISREYGVNDRTIASIRDRKSWKHVA
jgi:hypothetical protein